MICKFTYRRSDCRRNCPGVKCGLYVIWSPCPEAWNLKRLNTTPSHPIRLFRLTAPAVLPLGKKKAPSKYAWKDQQKILVDSWCKHDAHQLMHIMGTKRNFFFWRWDEKKLRASRNKNENYQNEKIIFLSFPFSFFLEPKMIFLGTALQVCCLAIEQKCKNVLYQRLVSERITDRVFNNLI